LFAKLVLRKGDSCPTTFKDMIARLREATPAELPCADKEPEDPEERGFITAFVSETAQALDKPTNFRSVTMRSCGGGSEQDLLFSQFGFTVGGPLPDKVEIISFDATAGVFNFYDAADDGLGFFGSSKDLLQGAGEGEVRRCAKCHPAGGLVMKELESPWLHWENENFGTPGTDDILAAHPELGESPCCSDFDASGEAVELTVKVGNDMWNTTKLAHLRSGPAAVKDARSPPRLRDVLQGTAARTCNPCRIGNGSCSHAYIALNMMCVNA
jgi:hypothetical protein